MFLLYAISLFSAGVIELPDPTTILPLQVGNYWVFVEDYVHDDLGLHDSLNFTDTIVVRIDRDTIVYNERWYYIYNYEPGMDGFNGWLKDYGDEWLKYDSTGNLIGRKDFLTEPGCRFPFGMLIEKINNGEDPEKSLVYCPPSGNIARLVNLEELRTRCNSISFDAEYLWEIEWGDDFNSGRYLFYPNVGYIKGDYGGCVSANFLCLIRAYVNGIYYYDPIKVEPKNWGAMKRK